jgi:hypothetical protein
VSANQFALKHRDIEIEYNIGITPGLPVFTYRDAAGQRSFTAAQVRVDDTALGSLVSVPLKTGGMGSEGERFGFYLPMIDLAQGQAAMFRTAGVYQDFSGVGTVPPQRPSWRSIELHGIAREVIQPLDQRDTRTAPGTRA